MNKTAIKNFAVWARRELISRVSQKAIQYGITEQEMLPATADAINGKVLSASEKKQRMKLISRINHSGYKQTMEEIAYTWFNRFCALRFMEVNSYLPSMIRVFTNEDGEFQPQILDEAIHLEMDGLDREIVFALKESNQTEELFKYLLITQCNALNSILPGIFQKIEDETELLFPDNLLREESVIAHMVQDIPETDWQDAVQIIGWLYQYYNTEPKDQVFANLKKNIKISKENIPAATQLFTPDWIVRYMVENSLGRIFINSKTGKWTGSEADRQKEEKSIAERLGWKYYLPEAEQTPEVRAELNARESVCNPELLKVIDPCMGSGHILVYMFDVLMQIYRESGYDDRTAAASIVSNNLFGLDIDERAAQLSYFAVMMKARQYDRGFFRRNIQPRVYAICESNDISASYVEYFCKDNTALARDIHRLISEMRDAKEYGSILNISPANFKAMYDRLDDLSNVSELEAVGAVADLRPLVQCGEVMAQQYNAVVTNPPYMGSSGMNAVLAQYVQQNYPDSKADLFAVFIERCGNMTSRMGYYAMITQHAWMFLAGFEDLRDKLLTNRTTINMAHLGPRAFEEIGGEVVQTTSFILQNSSMPEYTGTYSRLVDYASQDEKEIAFFDAGNTYESTQDRFDDIPGIPMAYWVSDRMLMLFRSESMLKNSIDARIGMVTGNNPRFLRFWYEVTYDNIEYSAKPENDPQKKRWYPLQKGGNYRLWYGNNEYVINWEKDGYELKYDNYAGTRVRSHNYNGSQQFKEGITWNSVSPAKFQCRYVPTGYTFDAAGPLCEVTSPGDVFYILGLLSSKIADYCLRILNPTINFHPGYLESLPLLFDRKSDVKNIVKDCVSLSKADWDSFETSWDFIRHPLAFTPQEKSEQLSYGMNADVRRAAVTLISARFDYWQRECDHRFSMLKSNEEELNRIFIDIYGLQDELTPDVEDKDVTVRTADAARDIRSFISYAVGCMLGRYSLDVDGLAYAGGEWDADKYRTFPADADNIIPICDDEYFEDDLTGRFINFVKTLYGEDTLEDNLTFIAQSLGGRGSARDVIRKYFRDDFFADHCKIYQKRPIYWLFDSGKKGGFRALVYMHRYRSDTLARMRTDYVHEQQERYRTAIASLEQLVDNASGSEKVKLSKQLTQVRDQAEEIRLYEEKIHHLADQMIAINLDDGVKNNYAIFQDVLAKIK